MLPKPESSKSAIVVPMDSCNSSLNGDWECISDVNSDVISLSTFGSTEPAAESPPLRRHDSNNDVFRSYRDAALSSNVGDGENPSIDFIPPYEKKRKTVHERSNSFPTKHSSFVGCDNSDDYDREILKFRQAQKRRTNSRLSQTKSKNRFSDKRSHTKFH